MVSLKDRPLPFRWLANASADGRRLWGEWWAMALAASAVLTVLLLTGATTRLDNAIYDISLKLERRAPRQDIVIVAIDPKSLARVRQWPWPRGAEAELIGEIANGSPKALACYFLFLFPTTPEEDGALHDAMVRTRTFIPLPRSAAAGPNTVSAMLPIPTVVSAVAGIGLGDQRADNDGIVRRTSLAEGRLNDQSTRMVVQMSRLGGKNVALDPRHSRDEVLIPYAGPAGTFKTISALSVLNHSIDPTFFKDKYVLVGATARDLLDDYPTPISSRMSNVEIDANVLNSLLSGRLIRVATRFESVATSLGVLWILLVALLRLRPRDNLRVALAMLLVPFVFSVVALVALDVWLPPVSFLLTVVGVTLYWGWRRLHAASDYFERELSGLQGHMPSGRSPEPRITARDGDVVLQQMTLLQEAKKRISDLRRFVSDILANFPEPIFVVDLDGRILTVNEAAVGLACRLGVSADPEASIDAILSRIIPLREEAGEGWPPIRELASRSGSPAPDQALTGRGPDGRAFELRLTPTLSAADEPSGWIVHLADITILMLAVDQREVAMRQREEALQLLSHDMRSPQASILAVLQHPDFQDAPKKLVQLIDLQARRTLDLADAFVRLAQAESADYTLEVLDFNHIAEEAVDAVWSLAHQGGVTVDLDTRGDEFIILADRGAVMRALVNLLDNAVKFSQRGASVACVVKAAVIQGRDAVACEIIDSAGGMPPALASRIFSRFATAGQATNGSSGIGLGLALVQAVTTRHGGSIVCRSSAGVGSVFTLTLPLHREAEDATTIRASA